MKAKSYPKGSLVIREGEKSDDLYLIKEGILGLTKNLDYLKEIKRELKPPFKLDLAPLLLNLGKGDLFGEDSFFFSKASTYSLTVSSASATILSLSKSDFLAAYPKLARCEDLRHFFKGRQILIGELLSKHLPLKLET